MRFALTLLLLAGCKKSDGQPAFAFDPIWIEPDGEGVHGFQTWEIYADGWQKRYKDRFYVCSVVVEFTGTPEVPDCTGCDIGWRTTPEILESDCAPAFTEREGLLSLSRLAIGRVVPEIAEGNPYPTQSQGGFADYASGEWETHGWAYPESLDTQGQASSSEWDGSQPFQLWPAFYWDLRGP